MGFIKGIRHYFVASHTAKGFVNFLNLNVKHIRIIVVSCPSLTIKTLIFQRLIKAIRKDYEDIEIFQNAHSGDFLDGLIVRDRSIAIVGDHIAPDNLDDAHIVELDYEYDLTDKKRVMNQYINRAYDHLSASLVAHEAIEKFYIQSMDFKQSNHLIEQVIKELFSENGKINDGDAVVYQRLFDSYALIGEFDLVPKLLQSVHKRYFIRGGPGTGKSFFMKQVLNSSLRHGYDVEQYMCSFDPQSTDMIIIRELNVCMLDSSGPHEFAPLSSRDQVIDLYQTSRTQDVSKTFEREIKQLREEQSDARVKGEKLLRTAGHQLKTIEAIFDNHANQLEIDAKLEEILNICDRM